MPETHTERNPFALMMNPEAIFAAIERSEHLACLKSRICRPLDEPRPALGVADVEAFDEAIEAAPEAIDPIVEECETRVEECETIVEEYGTSVEGCETIVEECETIVEECETLLYA